MSLCNNVNCSLMREHTPDECGYPVVAARSYGRDCPKGKVQVESVSVDPKLRMGDHGWYPSETARLEIWVDGERFAIEVGSVYDRNGRIVRGLQIISDRRVNTQETAVNSVTVTLDVPEKK